MAIFGWLAVTVAASAIFLSAAGSRHRYRVAVDRAASAVLELPKAKADAVYDLLAPDNVRVLVSRDEGGVKTAGSDAEILALQYFQSLITRLDGKSPRYVESQIRRMEHDDATIERRYDLRRSRTAKRLYRVLAFDDVPVIAKRRGSKLTVKASAEDHHVLASIVRIAVGQPLPVSANPNASGLRGLELPSSAGSTSIPGGSPVKCPNSAHHANTR